MSTLPKSLGVVRAGVAALLLHPHHVGRLYSAAKVANILKVAVDVDGDTSISAEISASLLLRVFTRMSMPYPTADTLAVGGTAAFFICGEQGERGSPSCRSGAFICSRWRSLPTSYGGTSG